MVPKSKTTAASSTLPRSEVADINELIIAYNNLDEDTENRAKGIQKLHEMLEDGAGKILRLSEAKVTKIQTRKEDSSQSKLKELQVLTNSFKQGMSIRNTTCRGGIKNDPAMNDLIIAYQELREKTGNQAIELQKINEKLEQVLDQTVKKHEDMMRISEAKKITKKKLWSGKADQCTTKDLEELTDNFSEENLIGDTSYGKLYRGKLKIDSSGCQSKEVIVKIWDDKVDIIDDGKVVKEEVKFLADSNFHYKNLPKLISFCNYGYCDDPLLKNGVVYDVNALGRLCDHIPKDNFSWIQRFKVVYELAKLLRHLQDEDHPFVLYNFDTENIVLNKEYSPIVVDFGLLFGGVKGGPRYKQQFDEMPYGYDDPYLAYTGVRTKANDVYSYGINLLALMAKRVDNNIDFSDMGCRANMLGKWALREYSGDGCSLVNSSLTEDEDYEESDGIALTKLALDCIRLKRKECLNRPSVFEVVSRLKKLLIFKMMKSRMVKG